MIYVGFIIVSRYVCVFFFFHVLVWFFFFFFFSSRRRHTRSLCDWSSDVCSSDLGDACGGFAVHGHARGRGDRAYFLGTGFGHAAVSPLSFSFAGARLCPEPGMARSEERRVGKGGRDWWWEWPEDKKDARDGAA